jgi:hypothetical protein
MRDGEANRSALIGPLLGAGQDELQDGAVSRPRRSVGRAASASTSTRFEQCLYERCA